MYLTFFILVSYIDLDKFYDDLGCNDLRVMTLARAFYADGSNNCTYLFLLAEQP